MFLKIKILQHGKKVREVTAPLASDPPYDVLRKLFEAETTLNSLPCNLRVHISVEEETKNG